VTAGSPTEGWLGFWSRPHRVYVNDRHRAVHFAKVADDLLALLPGPAARVLDFGCGEALEAGRVARRCARLYLFEAADPLRAALEARFAGEPAVRVLDRDGLAGLPAASLDLVVVNSVLQYLSAGELEGWLAVWREKLAPRGLLVLADVLPPESSAVADAAMLLRVAARNGFLLAALGGLASLALGDYRRLRRELGLTRWDPTELARRLEEAGFTVERRAANLGFNPNRMTFLARTRGLASGGLRPEGPAAVGEEAPEHHEPGGEQLGHEVVQAEPVAQHRHRHPGEQEARHRHEDEARDGRLVRPVARKGPASVEQVGDHPAHEVAGEGGRHGLEVGELDRGHERPVMADRRQHAHEREAPELPQDGPGPQRHGHVRSQTQPPSQT
jgi:SAM-dependent methyltransferase